MTNDDSCDPRPSNKIKCIEPAEDIIYLHPFKHDQTRKIKIGASLTPHLIDN